MVGLVGSHGQALLPFPETRSWLLLLSGKHEPCPFAALYGAGVMASNATLGLYSGTSLGYWDPLELNVVTGSL